MQEDILRCLYSISDNNSFLLFNRDPIDCMIDHLRTHFRPESAEAGASLAISGGLGKAAFFGLTRVCAAMALMGCYNRSPIDVAYICTVMMLYATCACVLHTCAERSKLERRICNVPGALTCRHASCSYACSCNFVYEGLL